MIHMEPFERGERPYHYDPKTVKTWRKVRIQWTSNRPYEDFDKMLVWCSNNCVGEWSASDGFRFEKDKDAAYFALVWK